MEDFISSFCVLTIGIADASAAIRLCRDRVEGYSYHHEAAYV